MNYLSVEGLSMAYGERELFNDLTFGISKGQKVALIAPNGSGKSTLLKILKGVESPTSGGLSFRKEIGVGYLDQDPDLKPENTVLEAVFEGDSEELKAFKKYQMALLGRGDLQAAIDRIEELGAWDIESRVKDILSRLKIENYEDQIKFLSGGQKKRVAIARLLIDNPEFFVLDEPTNHLDLDIIEWLEEYLAKANNTLLMITHDRYFLDNICDEIIELDKGSLHKYSGNYSEFIEKKAERIANDISRVEKAKNLYRKELDWVRRMPKARGTKAKYRVDAFDDVKKEAHQKIETDKLQLEVQSKRLGKKILELDGLQKSYDDLAILRNFNHVFVRGEKVGIVGPNGVGKTTFLRILIGEEGVDKGQVKAGENTVFGYYKQGGMHMPDDLRVIEVIKKIAESIPLKSGKVITASQMLERFLFSPKQQYQYVTTLSGGERRRLYLLTVLMANPNFLILDEPTNDLDIATLQVLEDFLGEFIGCIIIVSHDRFFMDKMVDHLFVFKGQGEIKDFPGNYTQFRIWEKQQGEEHKVEKVVKPTASEPKTDKVTQREKKLSYKEKFELESLDKEIPEIESKLEVLQAKLQTTNDHEDLMSVSKEIEDLNTELETKTERWMELSE